MTFIVATLVPELTNSQGDVANAQALVRQLAWQGVEASSVEVDSVAQVPQSASVIVLGHVVESQSSQVRVLLSDMTPWITAQLHDGAVVLAVGSAQHLLAEVGLLRGKVMPREDHVADDLVIESHYSSRPMWGFQNSQALYRRADNEDALGAVIRGTGNDDSTEGVLAPYGAGLVVGTNLHGPVCVRNPEFATWLLTRAGATMSAQSSTEWQRAQELAETLWRTRRAELEL